MEPFQRLRHSVSDPLIHLIALILYLNGTNFHLLEPVLEQCFDFSSIERPPLVSIPRRIQSNVKHCLSFPYLTLSPSHFFFDNCSTAVSAGPEFLSHWDHAALHAFTQH